MSAWRHACCWRGPPEKGRVDVEALLLPELAACVADRLLPRRLPPSSVMVRLVPLTSTASVSEVVPECVLRHMF